MIVRLAFFMLLLANIGYYGWQMVERRDVPETTQTAGPAPANGVPDLVLLKEREQQLLSGEAVNLGAGELETTSCFTLGPFTNQADLRRAFNAIAPHIEKSRQRQTVETQDRGFWVYLPAVESREDALRVARELSVAGLRDYYVVTAGEQENTISLGLFRQEDNARRRQSALRALGFDARIARRTEESLIYWLDYARLPDATPPWDRIVASTPGVDHRPIPCFR